ncbi:two-component regulator propeller domain-containing protein [Desulfococcaceae bacterium HSG9]|nr:two-component regulator propeller domain-containing protein [Desulfococcaceae bacterium HSG9]
MNAFEKQAKLFRSHGMIKKITVVAITLLTLICIGSDIRAQQADKSTLQFDHPLNTEGMIFNGGFIQDRDGFFWIGTQSGLLKYDGYDVKKYATGPGSISSDYVFDIHEDKDGLIWLTTPYGLNRYDKETDTFAVYKHHPENTDSISHNVFNWTNQAIAEEKDGNLWFGTQNGLNRYNKNTDTFVRYRNDPDNPQSPCSNNIWSLYIDSNELLWIGTDKGLDSFDKISGTFKHYKHDPDNSDSLSDNKVIAILEDSNGALWLGTQEGGLNRFDQKTETFTRYVHDKNNSHSISDNSVFSIYELKTGELWITHGARGNGLDVFDPRTEIFVNHRRDPSDPASLSFDHIMTIYKDRTGIIWLVSLNGKLDKSDKDSRKFKLYRHDPDNDNSLNDNLVTVIIQDRHGFIWIGLATGELDRYDPKTGTYLHYGHENTDRYLDVVTGMLEDSEGNFWVLGNKLCLFDRETGKCVKVYPLDCQDGSSLIEDRNNPDTLWFATNLGGLVKFDKAVEKITQYKHDPHVPDSIANNVVWQIFQDRAGTIWVPTCGGGLDRFDPKTEKVIAHYEHDPDNPASIGSDTLNHVYEDSTGVIWVGTVGGGLNRLNKDGTFKRYTEANGFPTNSVQNIIEDNNAFLWLGTKIGLIRFDPKNETAKLYTQADGLQGNEFWEVPHFKTEDGELWVFGGNGANSFYPDRLKDNPAIPPIVITSMTQGGEKLKLDKAPERVREITLDWRHNFFEFEYAALNYTNPVKNQYKYKLEGFDKDWYDAGTKRFGRYSNIPGGAYTLRIIGSNNDGVWNEEGVSLNVKVIPPFWKTWLFRLVLIFMIAGGIGGGFFLRVSRIKKQKRQLEIKVDERTKDLAQSNEQLKAAKKRAEIADQTKSAFLANMSHELRTPLNAVFGFAQLLNHSRNLDSEEREDVGIIMRSGEHLLTLINQLLDLSKIESGRMTLNAKNFDLYRLLDDITELFRLRSEKKHLQFLSERSPDLPRYIRTDEVKLRQVLINLLNNAFKFTDEGGVAMRVRSNDGTTKEDKNQDATVRIQVEIEDTGPGIAPDESDALFESFVQTKSGRDLQEGTGLGMPISRSFAQIMGGDLTFKSEVGRGSLFSFDIRVNVARADDLQIKPPARRVIGLEPNLPRYRILIVDDKWENRHLVKKLLKPLMFELREAADGKEAVKIWEHWGPHLIWMDMRMPVMDGYKATETIKATTKGQATAVIALTASAFDEEKAVVLSAGCDDFLRKPFKEAEIFDLMSKHLGLRYVYEEIKKPEPVKQKPKPEDVLTPEALASLPDDVLAGLRKAANINDIETVKCFIEQVRGLNRPVADAIAELMDDYRFDILQEVFERMI